MLKGEKRQVVVAATQRTIQVESQSIGGVADGFHIIVHVVLCL